MVLTYGVERHLHCSGSYSRVYIHLILRLYLSLVCLVRMSQMAGIPQAWYLLRFVMQDAFSRPSAPYNKHYIGCKQYSESLGYEPRSPVELV